MGKTSYQLFIKTDAELEILETIKYLNAERNGLGIEFLDAVEAVMDSIISDPLIFQLKYREFRVAYTARFSYGIHYTVEDTRIIVHAVLHTSMRTRS